MQHLEVQVILFLVVGLHPEREQHSRLHLSEALENIKLNLLLQLSAN